MVQEERVVFNIHAQTVSQMTVAKLRKIFTKFDGKIIARQVVPKCSFRFMTLVV